MALFRAAIMLLLVVAGVSFAFYGFTGQPRYKRIGLVVLKWTLLAALGFFLALFLMRLTSETS